MAPLRRGFYQSTSIPNHQSTLIFNHQSTLILTMGMFAARLAKERQNAQASSPAPEPSIEPAEPVEGPKPAPASPAPATRAKSATVKS